MKISLQQIKKLRSGTTSVVQWSEFLDTDPEVSGSIAGAARFSEK
jgi:hypothetical protein